MVGLLYDVVEFYRTVFEPVHAARDTDCNPKQIATHEDAILRAIDH